MNRISVLNFELFLQRSKCTKNPVYQLFVYFLFLICMSEIKSRPYRHGCAAFRTCILVFPADKNVGLHMSRQVSSDMKRKMFDCNHENADYRIRGPPLITKGRGWTRGSNP